MRYEQFREKVKDFPLISGQHLKLIAGNSQVFKNQLMRWKKAGKLICLKRNLYILNKNDRKINPSHLFIAYELYKPSYVSMEYALSYYGIIPEKVVDVSCITSKKTAIFENAFGKFIYQHVKLNCFTGYIELKDEAGLPYYMANSEKAVVDFIYLNQHCFKGNFKRTLTESFRFQNVDILNKKKLTNYAKLFASNKLESIVRGVK